MSFGQKAYQTILTWEICSYVHFYLKKSPHSSILFTVRKKKKKRWKEPVVAYFTPSIPLITLESSYPSHHSTKNALDKVKTHLLVTKFRVTFHLTRSLWTRVFEIHWQHLLQLLLLLRCLCCLFFPLPLRVGAPQCRLGHVLLLPYIND